MGLAIRASAPLKLKATLARYRIVRLVRLTSAPLLSSQIFGLESNRTSGVRLAQRERIELLVYLPMKNQLTLIDEEREKLRKLLRRYQRSCLSDW
jgi:hypothetical protein